MAAFADPRESGFDPELVKTALMSREQFSSKPRKLVLGIDMGIADIGICLMDGLNQEIVLMATHLFDCPRNPKDQTSLASTRRQARSQRRNIARRAARKKHIREILIAHGVIPEGADAEWFSVRKGERDNIQLRVKGLSEVLSCRELARILYGFASRRGYIDHGKADNDKDAGKVKKALEANAEIMEANGYETFAQYLITQTKIRNRQNDYSHTIDIDMVVDEVHTIFRHQRELGNELATESLEGEYLAALRWLTDTTKRDRIIYSKVGYCTYLGEPVKRNAPDNGFLKPYSSYSPICTNPVVLRSCAQLRRIINSIIRHYGLPDTIRVEVANDLKHTEHEKKIITSGNIFNRRTNEKAKDDIVQFFGLPDSAHVKGRDLEKVRLYNEQGGKDPYTGQGIDFGRMLTEKDYVEIDHVLPFSRSCDNSKTNKVLVLTKSNRDKANRTPYEWMTSGEPTAPNWDEFCIRMNVWAKGKDPKHYYSSKLAKLKEENFTNNLDTFISRNLNDTRYMSKDVAKWLTDCLPFPDDGRRHVFCVSGAATGLMRRVWRIGILDEDGKKDRDDDRHHAVDAAVIAACTPSVVKSIALISEEHATHRDADRLLNRSLPYPEFKNQVDAWIPCIVPTYSPTRTATGALFKENAYSYRGVDEKGKDLIKKKKGALGPCTTAWKDGKGTARAYDGQYGLLAVYNESTSRWLLDPLYYIDVQRRKAEKPFIRKFSKDLSIDYWEKIPLTGDEQTLFLKPGDVLAQDGLVGRLHSYDISVNTVKMYYARGEISFQKTGPLAAERFPTLSKWNDGLKIMQEDCLGLCWLEFLTDRAASC